jgi:hypothetical protein
MLHEEALALALDWNTLSAGESVAVVTRMGNVVTKGEVIAVFPYGAVQVREYDLERGGVQSIADRIYDTDLYLFIQSDAEEPVEVDNPDALEVPILIEPTAKGDIVSMVAEAEGAATAATPDQRVEKKLSNVRNDDRSAKAKVDLSALPKDLQKRLKGSSDLDDEARDRVLSAISEAAMKSLKAAGVKEIEIYPMIVKIHEALKSVIGV